MKEVTLLAIILFHLSMPSSADVDDGLSIDLIHRDSPLSPFYNSSMTETDFFINAAFHSNSRVKSFNFIQAQNYKAAAGTTVIPNYGDYLIKILIGTPPRTTYSTFDTGSDLIWLQCLPCNRCYKQRFPIFNPRKSLTYHLVPCDFASCKSQSLYTHSCGKIGQCQYEVRYGDGSVSRGSLSTDTISFNNSFGGNIVKYPNTILGCGHTNTGNFKFLGQGIVGLGDGDLSLLSQIGDKFGKRKFSYCLLPYNSRDISKLKFGIDTQRYRREVVTTPLVAKYPKTFYYLSLESLFVNAKEVKPEQTTGNVVIDSGTTSTYLKSSFYDKIEAAVVEALRYQSIPERNAPYPYRLCYREDKIKNFPVIALKFFDADYALELTSGNIFGTLRNLKCFLIVPTDGNSILGNLLQVSFNIEYDLDEKTVSFASADCTKN